MRNPILIIVFLILAALGAWIFLEYRVPTGIEPMGDSDELVAWMGLVGGALSFLAGIIGLIQKIIELGGASKKH